MNQQQSYFIQNLTLLLRSGMPIIDAVGSLSQEMTGKQMQKALAIVQDEVGSGWPLSKALEDANLLQKRYLTLLKVGEETGRLPEQLELIGLQIDKEATLKGRVAEALMYPATVLAVTVIVSTLTMVYTFPKLIAMFSSFGGTLPLSTRIIIALGHFFQFYGVPTFLLVIVVLAAGWFFLFRYTRTKKVGETILFSIPVIRTLIQEVELSRLGYMLGTLIKAGISIPQALESLEEGTSFLFYKEFYAGIRTDIISGNSLFESISHQPHTRRYVPPHIASLIASGEKSGALPETLLIIATTYEQLTDRVGRSLNALLEPIIIVIVGLLVALVALSIITPIYGLVSQFN